MSRLFTILSVGLMAFSLTACSSHSASNTAIARPEFSADSAMAHISAQLACGPRTGGSEGHRQCAAYIASTLARYGATITLQSGEMMDYSGRPQHLMNIIAHFGPDSVPSVLLGAHYDTRPWTDAEANYDDRHYCVPGANDGASGVAVLLEIARQLSLRENCPAVTLVFFDLEDMGTPAFYTGQQREDSWCLGSQYFAQHLNAPYSYGIVLDMVGAADAFFAREYYSTQYAPDYVEHIWHTANRLGYGTIFVDQASYPITDDHLPLCRAGIPTVDIVHFNPNSDHGFPAVWHTRQDDEAHICPATLQAVGEVVLSVL